MRRSLLTRREKWTFLMIGASALAGCGAPRDKAAEEQFPTVEFTGARITSVGDGATELAYVNFDGDTPGQSPSTGGPGQPSYVIAYPGTSILVQESANGIPTRPVVLGAEGASQYATVDTNFLPISQGVVRVEATVAFDRLALCYFLQTFVGTGPTPYAVVTRLLAGDDGGIWADVGGPVGTYAPNQPFRVRIDIDMSAKTWSAAIDNEMNGFGDDPMVPNLLFSNDVIPTVAGVAASLNLFSVPSTAPTTVAYDDIRVSLPAVTVGIDIKPGSFPNAVNLKSRGTVPVAILSSTTFDATQVNPATVTLAGATVAPIGKGDRYACNAVDVNSDSILDLLCHVLTVQLQIQEQDSVAELRATTFGGVRIRGQDSIRVVPK